MPPERIYWKDSKDRMNAQTTSPMSHGFMTDLTWLIHLPVMPSQNDTFS